MNNNNNNNNNNIYNGLINLVENIDMQNINLELVNKNVITLEKIFIKLKKIWNKIKTKENKFIQTKIYPNEQKFNTIIKIISDSFFSKSNILSNVINDVQYIGLICWKNIEFYWICQNNSSPQLENINWSKAINMFMISVCLNQYKFSHDDITRLIIWIPINKERNFTHKTITKSNLTNSVDKFEAFVASGVTFGYTNPKITIITRYEEIEKLLIHELIHNYNMDGSMYHDNFTDIIDKYIKYKNDPNSKTQIKNYDYEYSIYESYTELLSTYLYLLFENIDVENNKIREKILGQILIELLYSFNTIANLIKLNNYVSYDDFIIEKKFIGDICVYEYYYIKALMYNNYLLEFADNIDDFKNIYSNILKMIQKNNIQDDLLMKNIYLHYIEQQNYKYIIH